MFDSYTLRAGDQHHHHRTEVHEHRAPTDASVKLLREMEQAALDKILSTFRLEGAPVNCVIIHMRDAPSAANPLAMGHRFILRYKLGSRQREVRYDYRPSRLSISAQEANDECFHALKAALAEDIAFHLLADPFVNTLRATGFNLT
jgi:histidinol-phosphate/aromatic aminotransferase/cobyric acid decarboxylase-like protein